MFQLAVAALQTNRRGNMQCALVLGADYNHSSPASSEEMLRVTRSSRSHLGLDLGRVWGFD